MDRQDPPHPALEAALRLLREAHKDPAQRAVLNDIARLYHEGYPGAPEGIVPLEAVYQAMRRQGAWTPSLADFVRLGVLLHALGLWRLTKGAYLYDPDLAREVAATPITKLPVDLLFRLPEPAPLVLLPEGLPSWPEVKGFHVSLDQDQNVSPHLEARFLIHVLAEEGYTFASLVLDLDSPDLEKAVERTLARSLAEGEPLGLSELEVSPDIQEGYERIAQELLSLTLYLCQEAPDLGGLSPRPPAPQVRVKGGERKVFPPETPLVLPTGWRWGKAIRLARERGEEVPSAPTGKRVAPHVRRAHWHLYWVGEGARKDPAKARPVLRWVPAVLVNRDLLLEAGLTEEDLPAVARKVKKDR
ncbi:hypothetical protein HRbin39_01252 [bacterium HR39]|nr:hypothetical protein HRbin39_01252 [bacterium HR39]